MAEQLLAIIDFVDRLSGTLVVVLIIVGGSNKFRLWIFGWIHEMAIKQLQEVIEHERREKELWRQVAFKANGLVEAFADANKRA